MPHQGPDPNVQSFLVTAAATTRMAPPQGNAPVPSVQPPSIAMHTAPAHAIQQAAMQPVLQDIPSTPLLKISTAKMDKAIVDYWDSEDPRATDDQDFS
jgi:hypothetical protein